MLEFAKRNGLDDIPRKINNNVIVKPLRERYENITEWTANRGEAMKKAVMPFYKFDGETLSKWRTLLSLSKWHEGRIVRSTERFFRKMKVSQRDEFSRAAIKATTASQNLRDAGKSFDESKVIALSDDLQVQERLDFWLIGVYL